MEVSLFAFLSAAAIYQHEKARKQNQISLFSAVLFGVASLARPEGHLLFILAFLDIFFRNIRVLKSRVGEFLRYLGIYILFSLPYLLFSYSLTRRPFCSSYYSKMSISWTLSPVQYLAGYIWTIFLDNPVLLILAVFGLGALLREKRYLPVLWLLGFPLAASLKAPILIHHARYNMPLIPLYIAAGFVGLHRFSKKALLIICLIASISFSLFGLFAWAERYSFDAASIRNQHVRIAAWLNKNVPEGQAVATNDIGAISYLSGRNVVDLCGIVNPNILKIMRLPIPEERRRKLIYDYLSKRNVRYMAIYRNWFPWFKEDDRIKKVYEVHIKNNTMAGSDTMEVFKIQ